MNDIEQQIERQGREQIERTRQFLLSKGRPDLVAELDANLRDVQLGVAGARGTWHALSPVQRQTLASAADHPRLVRLWGSIFGFYGPGARAKKVCSIKTLIPLAARGLMCPEDDPRYLSWFAITERGRFVLKHGPH
jgi:hypothetical protein